MNLTEKISQRLMVGIRGPILDTETKDLLLTIKPGSVILFKRNIVSLGQVKKLIMDIKDLLPSPPLIAVDQEGGLVARFIKGVTVFPGNMALGATGSKDYAYRQGIITARELKDIGVDINLAPVVDVITTYHNPGITIRSFGKDSLRVSALGASCIRGTQEMKIAAVAKHFPGKGAAEADAHLDLPVVTTSRKIFEEVHLLPFQKAIEAGVKGIMSTHIFCPNLDQKEKRPATFSPQIVHHYLRDRFHFPGVIFSDDLEMGAIAKHFPIGDACIQAVLSGHDMLLICSDYDKQRAGLAALQNACQNSLLPIKELDESVARIQSLKDFCRKKPGEIPSHPEKEGSHLLSQKIAEQSIALIGNEKGLLPLRTGKEESITLIMPDLSPLDGLEEGYLPSGRHFFIKEFKKLFSGRLDTFFVPIEMNEEDIENICHSISENSTVIAFIFDAQAYQGQRNFLKRLQQLENKVIPALIRNPFDIEFLPSNDTCLITFGFRKVQLLALLKVIFGKIKAKGRLPF